MIRHTNLLYLVLILSSLPAFAAGVTYRIPQIADNQKSCEDTEAWLVKRFEQLTEATVVSHGCELNNFRTFDLVIEHSNLNDAHLVTTYDEFDFVHGLYESAEQCAAYYGEEFDNFRNATGVEPLMAYCLRDMSPRSIGQKWVLRIDGFGRPRLTPQHLVRNLYSRITSDLSGLERELITTLSAIGAKYVRAKITNFGNHATILVQYYAAKKLPILEFTEARFNSIEACQSNGINMETIFARAGSPAAFYTCGVTAYPMRFHLYSVGAVIHPLGSELTQINYTSIDLCEAKRKETELSWVAGFQKNVVGSVCAIFDGLISESVRMRIFWVD